jgi:hypothetical protein
VSQKDFDAFKTHINNKFDELLSTIRMFQPPPQQLQQQQLEQQQQLQNKFQ